MCARSRRIGTGLLTLQEPQYFRCQVGLKVLVRQEITVVDITQLDDPTVFHVASEVLYSLTLERIPEVLPSLHDSRPQIRVGIGRDVRRPVDREKRQGRRRDPRVVGIGLTGGPDDRAQRALGIGQRDWILRARIGGEFVTALVVVGGVQIYEPVDAGRVQRGEARHLASGNGESNERRALDPDHIHEGPNVGGQGRGIVASGGAVRLPLTAARQSPHVETVGKPLREGVEGAGAISQPGQKQDRRAVATPIGVVKPDAVGRGKTRPSFTRSS